MSIKTVFNIKDLEHLSGIKAHTIRIWEKRYNLFKPDRSVTNIRSYDLEDLSKLLNIVALLDSGRKISHVSKLSITELQEAVKSISITQNSIAIQNFKMAMFNFDSVLFNQTYLELQVAHDTSEIFQQYFYPLLTEIGILWMTNTINPAHEHFISTLIQQKILIEIEKYSSLPSSEEDTFVLFLPLNEIHELGLLYIHYELNKKGYKSIYLGSSVPIDSLIPINESFKNLTFISYFTVEPNPNSVFDYLKDFETSILKYSDSKLFLLGKNTAPLNSKNTHKAVSVFKDIASLITKL